MASVPRTANVLLYCETVEMESDEESDDESELVSRVYAGAPRLRLREALPRTTSISSTLCMYIVASFFASPTARMFRSVAIEATTVEVQLMDPSQILSSGRVDDITPLPTDSLTVLSLLGCTEAQSGSSNRRLSVRGQRGCQEAG
jgi:hypothetical protein